MTKKDFDACIVGGGLAGLACSIELSRRGYSVVLFEKNIYPFNKVCGEYISNESWDYLNYLGVGLEEMNLPQINQLQISTQEGNILDHELKLGGFGISRYTLDYKLCKLAKKLGVVVYDGSSVDHVSFEIDSHQVSTKNGSFSARLVVGSYGKRNKLDKVLNRGFIKDPLSSSKNFIAVKYHIKANLPDNKIGLHIFKDGYCGVSKVDGKQRYCLCYLTLAKNLQLSGGSIKQMEKDTLSQNLILKELLTFPRFEDSKEVIAQINFSKKELVVDQVYMLGDSAGLIVPLCGNGMSMALNSAYEFSSLASLYLSNKITRKELERQYKKWWKNRFFLRITIGRFLQRLFYLPFLVNPIIHLLSKSNLLSNYIVSLTHGKNFLTKQKT